MLELTAAQQNYVQAIYEQAVGEQGAYVTDVATALSVSKASASRAIKWLEKKELVWRGSHREVFLTEEGELQAILMRDKFDILKDYFMKELDLDEAQAEKDAFDVGNVISTKILCSMCQVVKRADRGNFCKVINTL